MKTLGEKIRGVRQGKGMTQAQLGTGIVTAAMISMIESGRAYPSMKVLSAIADKLQQPIHYLITEQVVQGEYKFSLSLARALMETSDHEKAYSILLGIGNFNEEIYRSLAECCCACGKLDEADHHLDSLEEIAILERRPAIQIDVLSGRAAIAEKEGNLQVALYYLEKAYQVVRKEGVADPAQRTHLVLRISGIYLKVGSAKQALTYLEELEKDREWFDASDASLQDLSQMMLQLALVNRELHFHAKAAEYADQAMAVLKLQQNQKMTNEVKRTHAVLLGEQGDTVKALQLLGACKIQYERQGLQDEIGRTELEMARILRVVGEHEKALAHAKHALAKMGAVDVESARAHFLLAHLTREMGDRKSALSHLQVAMNMFAKNGQTAELLEAMQVSHQLYEEESAFWSVERGTSAALTA